MRKRESEVVAERKNWHKPTLLRLAVSSTEDKKHKT